MPGRALRTRGRVGGGGPPGAPHRRHTDAAAWVACRPPEARWRGERGVAARWIRPDTPDPLPRRRRKTCDTEQGSRTRPSPASPHRRRARATSSTTPTFAVLVSGAVIPDSTGGGSGASARAGTGRSSSSGPAGRRGRARPRASWSDALASADRGAGGLATLRALVPLGPAGARQAPAGLPCRLSRLLGTRVPPCRDGRVLGRHPATAGSSPAAPRPSSCARGALPAPAWGRP